MPIRKEDYPPNWKEISLQVREEAGHRCEWCQAPNHQVIERLEHGAWRIVAEVWEDATSMYESTLAMPWPRLRFHRLTRVVLTVAHLDRNPGNNERSNLAALCQRCHLRHDIRQHVAARRYGRDHAKEQQGKLEFKNIIH